MRTSAALLSVTLLLAACATANARDWQAGPEAIGFDDAVAQCRGQRSLATDAAVGEATFTLCMNAKGWRKR